MAVFNGYDGNYSAQLAADELHHALLCELQRFDPFTTCSCAYNMIEGHQVAAMEIHRPRTRASARVKLHSVSNNAIEQIIHTCEERLDRVAASVATRHTPVVSTVSPHETGFVGHSPSEPDNHWHFILKLFRFF